METVTISIDGQKYEVEKGIPLVLAAERAGVRIPHLCFNEGLSVFAGCRVCVVQIEGARGLPTSCTTPTADGQVVWTKIPEVLDMQRGVMSLILADHPDRCLSCHRQEHCGIQGICLRDAVVTYRCLTCAKNGRCEFQSTSEELEMHRYPMRYYQERHSWYGPDHVERPIKRENPFIELDFNECILCTRCVRACDEVRDLGCYELQNKGPIAQIGTSFELPLQSVGCDGCGACIDVCPVNSIMDKPSKWKGPAAEITSTTCNLCPAGCTLDVETKNGAFLRVSANKTAPANHGVSCARGRWGLAAEREDNRLAAPMVKRDGRLVETTWDEALKTLVEKLPAYKGSFAAIAAARLTNEDGYLLHKLATQVLGGQAPALYTPIDDAALVAPLADQLGIPASTNPLDDIAAARTLLVFGSDPVVSHPIAAWEARREARYTGGKLIVANPRKTEFVQRASQWLQYRPGTESALVAGLLATILEEGLTAQEFVAASTNGLDALQASLQGWTPARAAEVTGVAEGEIRAAARAFASSPAAAIIYDTQLVEFSADSGAVSGLVNLSLATGQIGKAGAGIHVLRADGNSQGLSDLGLRPGATAGVLDAVAAGQTKAVFIAGANPVAEDLSGATASALQRAEFVVVAANSLHSTAQLADVVLPLTVALEQDGTITNSERRVQATNAAFTPASNARPLWQVLGALAGLLNASGFAYGSAAEVFDAIAGSLPVYQGLSFAGVAEDSQVWPAGQPVLYTNGFPNGKAQFRPLSVPDVLDPTSDAFPLRVAAGRELLPYHREVLTEREDPYTRPWDDELVKISEDDAQRLAIEDGETVRLTTTNGTITVKATVTDTVPAGSVVVSLPVPERTAARDSAAAAQLAAHFAGTHITAARIEK